MNRWRMFFGSSIALLGIILLTMSWGDPLFRNEEGALIGSFALPLSVCVAFILSGLMICNGLNHFAFWFGLGLIGQAIALQLIEAGPGVGYQHYKPFVRIFADTHPALVVFLAIQIISVLSGIRNRWKQIKVWQVTNLSVWQVMLLGCIVVIPSATVSHDVFVYLSEMAFAGFLQLINLGNLILIVWNVPAGSFARLKKNIENWFVEDNQENGRNPFGIEPFVLVLAVWVFAFSAFLNFMPYEQHPHLQDEVGYLYHASFLAQGNLTLPAPEVPEAFNIYLMHFKGDQWFPSTPPGWPAMLAVGVFFGVPWLINPFLAGLNIILAYVFLREVYPNQIARISICLLSVSPWNLFLAMSFMPHTFTLTCTLAALVAVAWLRKTEKVIWGLVGGGAVGLISLIRPLDGLIVAVAIGLWAIGIGGRRLHVSAIAAMVLGTILIGGAVLPYNKTLTGDPLKFPIMEYTDQHFAPKSNAYGFGPERGMGWAIDPNPGHGPVDGLINANLNTFAINIELFGWSIGSLALIGVFLVLGPWRQADYLFLVMIGVVFIAYFFYYFSGGPDFGARYWFLMLIPLIVFAAKGITSLEKTFYSFLEEQRGGTSYVQAGVFILCIFSLLNFVPWRSLDKYFHYLDMRPDIKTLAQQHGFGNSLVLIQGKAFPDFASAAAYNILPFTDSAPIYVWDRDPQIKKRLFQSFGDRPIWIVGGPSKTDAAYKVLKGPIVREH